MRPFFYVSLLQGLSDWDLQRRPCSSLWAIPCLMLSSAGVAPLSPGFLKLLRDTVTIFAVFPLGCTFRVATSIACCPCHLVRVTLRISCWQGGDICQAIATSAFALFIYALWSSSSFGCSPSCQVLLFSHRVTCSTFLIFRCHREVAFAQGSRACFPFYFFSIFLFLLILVRSFRQPSIKFSSSGVEM